MLINDKQGFLTFRLHDTSSQTESCEQDDDDSDVSVDSVYEALIGRSAPRVNGELDILGPEDDITEGLDDTFVDIRKHCLTTR